MYRSVALKAIEGGLLESIRRDPGQVASILEGISIRFEGERILLDGRDVSREIRDNRVSREVSFLSSLKPVRDCLLVMQQALGRGRGVVMDGRDIGTVVFPDAELKIFLVADARERARRRLLELQAKSEGKTALPDIETLEREILERDRADAEREHAPLRKHPDAVEIDTSKLDIDQQVEMVYRLARKTEAAG